MDARARLAELEVMNIANMDIVESRPLRRERKKLRKLLYRQKGKFFFFFFIFFLLMFNMQKIQARGGGRTPQEKNTSDQPLETMDVSIQSVAGNFYS